MTEMYLYSQGGDGVEYLYIPVDSATLKQFIEDQQNNNVGWRLCFSVILKIPWNQFRDWCFSRSSLFVEKYKCTFRINV